MQLFLDKWPRWIIGIIAVMILGFAYLFQNYDFSSLVGSYSPNAKFIINKTIRFLLNDTACLLLIMVIFNKSSYLRVSTWIFLTELIVFLPLYFILKLSLEGDSEISSPLLSQLHRMIVNPLLMFAMIMGFFYQKYFWKKPSA
ncbi:MAG: exosortase F system-associated protein [Cyclobacteriaceae bacterium]|nr:exosortase F system-associated protein [Cyclobacteriaceae bacterium]